MDMRMDALTAASAAAFEALLVTSGRESDLANELSVRLAVRMFADHLLDEDDAARIAGLLNAQLEEYEVPWRLTPHSTPQD
jgi:hypothetical protein